MNIIQPNNTISFKIKFHLEFGSTPRKGIFLIGIEMTPDLIFYLCYYRNHCRNQKLYQSFISGRNGMIQIEKEGGIDIHQGGNFMPIL